MPPRDTHSFTDKIPEPLKIGAIALTFVFGTAATFHYTTDAYLGWNDCNHAKSVVDKLDNEKTPITDEDKKSLLSPYCD